MNWVVSKMDCVFCKIIEGKIPANKVYENGQSIAFLDINPVNKGHTLVVPKQHFVDLFAVPQPVLHDMIDAVQKVAQAVKNGVHAEGINIGMNNGGAAGQVVFHAHMHVIPRSGDDGLRHWPSKKYADGEITAVEKTIRQVLQ
ncbi:MAG: HIT family protein [Thaumarchaeota archaeon]|nr:HIT family protein [Nitrososphaerota archaeon]